MRARGFTLIELMVAIFITAIVFALGYGAINQAVNSRDALEERQERLLEVQTAMRVISQDINQITPRAVRDPSGNSMQPVLESSSNSQPFLQLTRGGWANPAGVQRPTVQRVAYILREQRAAPRILAGRRSAALGRTAEAQAAHRREVRDVQVHGHHAQLARHVAAAVGRAGQRAGEHAHAPDRRRSDHRAG